MDTQRPPRPDTKTRILDVAERLFALAGFKRTSIKRLACAAGVNQAAVNYHFGSKAALIEKVIERRMGPINRQRIQRIEAVRRGAATQGRRPRAEDLLHAFIAPAFAMNGSVEGKTYFLTIAGRAVSEPDAAIRTIFVEQIKPPFMLLFQAMREALPDMPEKLLLRRLHLAIGSMNHCMGLCSVNLLPPDLFPPVDDLESMTDLLLDFVASGMKAPHYRENEPPLIASRRPS